MAEPAAPDFYKPSGTLTRAIPIVGMPYLIGENLQRFHFGPISPYLAIGEFISPRDPFILSIHHEISGIPRFPAQTTFRNAFSQNPARDPASILFQYMVKFGRRPQNFCSLILPTTVPGISGTHLEL